MAIIKCKACGGDLIIQGDATVAECEFCGTKQTLPRGNEEALQNLFNRANALRLRSDFDKAEQLYEKILQENDAEPEAHWGIVLCRYGIEYVEDPATYRRVPTCHRTSYDAILADSDYLAAMEYADAEQRRIYEAEARAIDEIQKNILSIVKSEKPFDVFICYKETDENGKRTIDSSIANDIYYELTDAGYKVFYAAITLEDKLGQEYEPYIFAALNSAKVLLAVGTKPEYFTSPWVKNEWGRFLKLMKTDRSKQLFPCYRDMDAYELPEEFARLQAQDMSKIGFINDIVRGIKKVLTKDAAAEPVRERSATTASAGATAPLLRRAFLFLEDRDWENADEYCEKVLDIDPENAQAYLGKLMVEAQVKFPEQLAEAAIRLDNSNNYQKALRFGDESLRTALRSYNSSAKERIEKQRLARQQEEEERRRKADEERRQRVVREAEERRIREEREAELRRQREEKANREREEQRRRDELRRQEEERRAAALAEEKRQREEKLEKRMKKHKNLRTVFLSIVAACSVVGGVRVPELAPPAGVFAMLMLQAYFLFPTALALRKRKWGETPVILFALVFCFVQLFAGIGFATSTDPEIAMEPLTGICLIISAISSAVIVIIRKKI